MRQPLMEKSQKWWLLERYSFFQIGWKVGIDFLKKLEMLKKFMKATT